MLCALVTVTGYEHTWQISFWRNLFADHLAMSADVLVTSGQLTEDPDLAIIRV